PSFLLIGELTDQDYNLWINPATLDTATNYQLYEHIWQSFNQQDFWQLKDIINRERNIQKGIYANLHLTNFVGNHDTSRIYNLVHDKENIELIFTFLFTYPGIPCLYYGDEILLDGKILTNQSKYVRQPMPSLKNLDKHQNEFLEIIKQLIQIRKDNIGFSIGQITILSCDHHHFAYQITHKKDNYIIVLKTKHDHKTNQIYFKSDSINNHQFINLINQEKYQIIENILHFPNHAHRLILKQI
ncbi:hypothetical protein KJ855_02245, partial [Patescibacteria group bacterium]|nr:hypothetical protein [Patescibacteria group bacterium]